MLHKCRKSTSIVPQFIYISQRRFLERYIFYSTVAYTYLKGVVLIICCCVDDLGVLELVGSDFECSKDGEMASQVVYISQQTLIEWYVFDSIVVNT